jgi:hypothetical protein
VQHTVRDTVHHMEGFFTHFLGHVGLFLLVALLVCLAGYAALRCIKAGARACGAPDNCSVQLRYVVGALVVYVALSAGFATLGLDFPHIVLSLGFATIALGAGFAACFANMVAGFTLRDDADFRLGTRALTWYGGVQYSGVVTEMSLRHVVLYDADTGRRHRLPNALFETSPTTILYDGGGGNGADTAYSLISSSKCGAGKGTGTTPPLDCRHARRYTRPRSRNSGSCCVCTARLHSSDRHSIRQFASPPSKCAMKKGHRFNMHNTSSPPLTQNVCEGMFSTPSITVSRMQKLGAPMSPLQCTYVSMRQGVPSRRKCWECTHVHCGGAPHSVTGTRKITGCVNFDR